MKIAARIVVIGILVLFGMAITAFGDDRNDDAFNNFMLTVAESGVGIENDGGVIAWTANGGLTKPNGPLAGKRIGLLVGCEFSDWQAYYLASYIAEYGGKAQFIMDNNHLWKETRPMRGIPTEPHGMWGLSLTGGMSGLGLNNNKILFPAVVQKGQGLAANYDVANPADYDALIILGGHSGDVLYADDAITGPTGFLTRYVALQRPIAAIGGGILPLIKIKAINGRHCTGNSIVDYMLKRVAIFHPGLPVVADTAKAPAIITGRETVDTPLVLRELAKVMGKSVPNFENILKGKRVLMMITSDWEDIELCAPTMELIYRGATFYVGLFNQEMKSRPALPLDLKVREGSFGTAIPFQEIPESYYKILNQEDIHMNDFDLVWIPGAFNPWQITVLHKKFLKQAYRDGKIVASICHGPIPVAAAGLATGKKMTGWLACEDPVNIMGGTFIPAWAAAIDGRIVTGRTPPEVPEFVNAMTGALLKYKKH